MASLRISRTSREILRLQRYSSTLAESLQRGSSPLTETLQRYSSTLAESLQRGSSPLTETLQRYSSTLAESLQRGSSPLTETLQGYTEWLAERLGSVQPTTGVLEPQYPLADDNEGKLDAFSWLRDPLLQILIRQTLYRCRWCQVVALETQLPRGLQILVTLCYRFTDNIDISRKYTSVTS